MTSLANKSDDAVNFYRYAVETHLNGRPSWEGIGEDSPVQGVHFFEVGEIGQVHANFHGVLQPAPSRLSDALNISQAQSNLVCELHRPGARCWVDWNLARHV